MEKVKKVNFEDGFELPEGLEMFNLTCNVNAESRGISVTFGFMKDEVQLELMKAFGKEKEYQDFLESVSKIMESVFDELNKVTINFIRNELLKSPVLNREELDILISKLLARAILGGRR